jgi:hypothetical protein
MNWRVTASFLVVVLSIVPIPAHADYTQGSSCSSKIAGGPIGNSANDDGNNLVCISGTWQYPTYVMRSAAASAQSSCSGYPAGAERWNTTLGNLEVCDGTTWQLIGVGTSTCGSVSGLSFTNLTSQALSTVITSNTATITFSGCSGALSVSVSGAATAQISINGGAWGTSGAIATGQTLQVRLTSSGSVSTTLTATVTVGGSSTNWTVTTRSGSLKVFATGPGVIGSAIGSLSNADALCQSAAGTAGYAGTYKAIMSDDSTNAKDRLTLSYPIVNAYDGSTVAATNLWIGSVTNAILNTGGWNGGGYWTGTNADGTKSSGNTCSSWTGGTNGVWGWSSVSDSGWVNRGTLSCSTSTLGSIPISLACIQQ